MDTISRQTKHSGGVELVPGDGPRFTSLQDKRCGMCTRSEQSRHQAGQSRNCSMTGNRVDCPKPPQETRLEKQTPDDTRRHQTNQEKARKPETRRNRTNQAGKRLNNPTKGDTDKRSRLETHFWWMVAAGLRRTRRAIRARNCALGRACYIIDSKKNDDQYCDNYQSTNLSHGVLMYLRLCSLGVLVLAGCSGPTETPRATTSPPTQSKTTEAVASYTISVPNMT